MCGIIRGNYSARSVKGVEGIRLLNWNIERGLKLPAIMEFIGREKPDVCLFQEIDLNARRTGKRNIADLLAVHFEFNYVFGVEFEELSQGSKTDRAFHGQAVFARGPISRPRILRFSQQSHAWDPHWYVPNVPVFQRRRGGRMALTAEIGFGARRLVVYDLHLESQGDDRLRLFQLTEVVRDSLRYPADVPVVVAGDLNSHHSPSVLSAYLLHSGFRDACGGNECRVTTPHGRTLDWIFTRGPVVCSETRAHHDVRASDHYPVSTVLALKF